jgi:hypothetical protein
MAILYKTNNIFEIEKSTYKYLEHTTYGISLHQIISYDNIKNRIPKILAYLSPTPTECYYYNLTAISKYPLSM